MSPFLFTLWRFGWARANYRSHIGGWRWLFWRLWWRLPPPVLAPPIYVTPTPPPRPPAGFMHWSPDDLGLPLCGAKGAEPWTREFAYATCRGCREKGLPLLMQYECNTR